MNVYLTYLGCRLNESEVEELAWRFAALGQRVVADPAQADVGVVNTCTVTAEAGRKSRQLVRRLARLNPGLRLAVTGCHATVAPDELVHLPQVGWVASNAEKERLAERVVGAVCEDPTSPMPMGRLIPGTLGRTRAFVKVQDGCDNRCTFCITALARGKGRSRAVEQILAEVQELVRSGYQEVLLSGVHLGSYGRDRGEKDGLSRLIRTLLSGTDIARLRLSSLEPWELSASFLDLWEDSRLCRQLHLPLQSGCDAVLRRMGRRSTTAGFAELVAAARARIPDLALTTDIMVGFPGESEQAFEESYRYVQALEFARLHVFAYSARPGTAAADMPDQVPVRAKAERSRAMRQLGETQARAFQRGFVGRTLPVLWESARTNGLWRGLTDNYLTVVAASETALANRITQTRLVASEGEHLRGEVHLVGTS